MTRDELKIRTQQTIDAIPVLREKEYGWTEIEKMLNEIMIELDDTPWHTGTPTEEGWYLQRIKSKNNITYDTDYYENGDWKYPCVFREIVAWQKIEEKEDGRHEK